VVSVPQPTGKAKRKHHYGETRKEVAEQNQQLLAAIARGDTVDTARQTVAQFLNRWLADVVQPKAAGTYRSYSGIVRLHILPDLGRHELAKLTPQHVQALLRAKAKPATEDNEAGELADHPCTVQRIREVLRNALNQALRWGLVTRNAAALVDPPRYTRPEIAPFDEVEARAFLAVAEGDTLGAISPVALALGLRQGEALGLTWEDIDYTAGTLRVRQQVQRVKGKLILKELKTAKSRRTLPLPDVLIPALREQRKRQRDAALLAGGRWQGNAQNLVFTSKIGTPLDARNVVRRFKALLVKAGLRDQRFHDLRHACASLLLAQGIPARVVMEILGHSQISLTLNTYSHVTQAVTREAATAISNALRKTG
jgi:integrase